MVFFYYLLEKKPQFSRFSVFLFLNKKNFQKGNKIKVIEVKKTFTKGE
jgi:hypothetical protein